MAHEHGHHEAHHHGPRALPATLTAPPVVAAWRTRAVIVAAVFLLASAALLFVPGGRDQVLRAYLAGFMLCFNLLGGALAFLMVQYVSGGKWGHILRRPLEAMTRTWLLVVVMFLPIVFFMKKLYLWAMYTTPQATMDAWHKGFITQEEHLDLDYRHIMLAPVPAIVQSVVVLGFIGLVVFLLNKWSIERDNDPQAGTAASYTKWRKRFENLSGPSILFYVILLTDFVIVWVKSLDIIWASSVFGLQFLVAQGYAVLAVSVLTMILLSKAEPIKTLFRTTEQHDIAKLMFAFTMLNIYLTFSEFLIIWSGNIPDELFYYLKRIHGGWWTICTADVILHWVIPFCLLLSRDIKRSKKKLIWVCCIMLTARLVDIFWLVAPSFKDQQEHLRLSGNLGILAFITVPVAMLSIWTVVYLTNLMQRPLLNLNDPHTEELLEPEHAH
ncbi:hypothetical protein ACFQBQ_09765 [Granulicella cerasi]|uniref:Quinol:cytochrome c oxidoreductase quinone-binding subunit 2 n=1 Tax=Granulicella cerasi TaxID=741063 RepID=A0ABW1ZBN8_9BACT|nr:hypothetical protein [Granulicella cerasi]